MEDVCFQAFLHGFQNFNVTMFLFLLPYQHVLVSFL